jgi:hypothetical protein
MCKFFIPLLPATVTVTAQVADPAGFVKYLNATCWLQLEWLGQVLGCDLLAGGCQTGQVLEA